MNSRVRLLLLPLLLLASLPSCYRPTTATLHLSIPDADSTRDLETIRETLLEETSQLPQGVRFYHTIEINPPPDPELIIVYHPDQIRIKNILHAVEETGFSSHPKASSP